MKTQIVHLYIQGQEFNYFKSGSLQYVQAVSAVLATVGGISISQFLESPTVNLLHCVQLFLYPKTFCFSRHFMKFREQRNSRGRRSRGAFFFSLFVCTW